MAEAQVDKCTDNAHDKELAQQAIVRITRHLWEVRRMRERMIAEIAQA